jgi:dTDP-4-dehydrorhamnose 3,5-epimerase
MGWLNTEIEGVKIFEPRIFSDDRGHFFESFNQEAFENELAEKIVFVQDNESISKKGVIRGLHFQKPPFAQGKLVRVVQGSVIDVAVDIRKNSTTYGKSISIELSAENHRQLWIPEGFAHGFEALEDETIFLYKCTNYYSPQSEATLLFNDPAFRINWQTKSPIISDKDLIGEQFSSFITPFE